MRRTKLTNLLLTLNALLMAGVLWALAAGHVPFASTAEAGGPRVLGIPNAAEQRLDMIKELRKLNATVADMRKEMDRVEFRVKVTSMPKVRLEE